MKQGTQPRALREIRTGRLVLRRWRAEDAAPFAALNADPVVREFFPGLLTREESDASMARMGAHFDTHGFGLWAVTVSDKFIGHAGIMHPNFAAPTGSLVEIGWRLEAAAWGKGYATEAARAVLVEGFEHFGQTEIVSFAVTKNVRSRRVMEKLGFTRGEDFEHPSLPPGHPSRLHVLYRLRKEDWDAVRGPLDGQLVF